MSNGTEAIIQKYFQRA